jgi:exopolyphosphatase / guanosine-5'-triphosphate,3'-diphosphate pyrophosphatase
VTDGDREEVAELLGRPPMGGFQVVVRDERGHPTVIRNEPLLDDGTPMPTRWWLVGRAERDAVSRLEASGGTKAAELAVDPAELAGAHERYAAERDAALPAGHRGPRPSGGVGGTTRGVKCLHAHLAWFLAGGDDPVGRWVAERLALPAPGAGAVAAIDCGTNSTRLLVAEPDGMPLERLMRITRLGQGVDAAGRLATDAISRTATVLREYRAVMDRHDVVSARATATSAARDATNRADFFVAAEAALGVGLELLSGDAEGRLSFAGATAELDPHAGPYLVVDIGGGSTELVTGAQATPGDGPADGCGGSPSPGVVSVELGCVRVTERFLHHDPPLAQELADATAAVHAALDGATAALPAVADAVQLVGLAGTVTTLSAIDQGVATYRRDLIHHSVLSRGRIEELLDAMAGETRAERLLRPGLEEARADVIVGGAVVLAGLMRHLDFERCLVSEADILDGLVMSQLGRRQ